MTRSFFFALLVLWTVPATHVHAQENTDSNAVLEHMLHERYLQDREMAERISRENNIPLRAEWADGTIVGFSRFAANGVMLFDVTSNVGAGRTISVNKVWPGGTTGTSLNGDIAANSTGRLLGIWDGGAVRTTHNEFGSRVTQVDGSTDIAQHPTHVAGTMMGSGVQSRAKGMSYAAKIRAYDWDNRDAEITNASATGMLVSNHSYGAMAGWQNDGSYWYWYGDVSVSATEDYKYGFYNSEARFLDQVTFNNPRHLICRAAGNDRDKSVSTSHYVLINNQWTVSSASRNAIGPYNSIATAGNAKNILTVGAVKKITPDDTNNGWVSATGVVMTSFSGWGPTDDGRIKPDVVGAGEDVYSASSGSGSSNSQYASLSGTSMATPNVSGGLFLLQEHYHNIKDTFMRSASLKALAIHTADEAGSAPGPDYRFGWGLVNINKAVQLLLTDSTAIRERTLTNKSVYSESVLSNGITPLKVTLCWTDRAGTPVAPSLNPTQSMLVNDLDIRLIRKSDSMVFMPYILNPAIPAQAATTGDNFRDNVEQILLQSPQAGDYRIVVSHKRDLQSRQAQTFSLIVSGTRHIAPTADFRAERYSFCTGDSVTFQDASINDPSDWAWTFHGAVDSVSNLQNPVVTYATPGIYAVTLIVTNLAGKDTVVKTGIIEIREKPGTITFSGVPNTTAYQENTYTVNTPRAGSTYQWTVQGGVIVTGQGSQEITIRWDNQFTGRVAVRETNTGGCVGDSVYLPVSIQPASGINDPYSHMDVTIFPNPASDYVTIRFHAGKSGTIRILISDMLGRTVYKHAAADAEIIRLETGNIPAGAYLLKVVHPEGETVQKLMFR